MRKVILASHGAFAQGALESVSMIIGEQENVTAYHMHPGENAADFAEELRAELAASPETEYLILTDLYGASVCSALMQLSIYENVRVFSGMNLCLILEILTSYPNPLTDRDIEEILSTARDGIKLVKMENTEQEEF